MAIPSSAQRGAAASVLAEGLTVTGRIAGDGDLEVRGRLEGEIEIGGEITLAQGSLVKANLAGARVVVRGALLGDVRASDSIVLEPSARVVGDLTAPRISIALGAQIRGNLDMRSAPDADAQDIAVTTRFVKPAAARPAPVAQAPVQPSARPMAQKGPITPAKPVAVSRKPASTPVAAAPAHAEARSTTEPPPDGEPRSDSARKEPPSPVVPSIKKGQKAQPKRKGAEAK